MQTKTSRAGSQRSTRSSHPAAKNDTGPADVDRYLARVSEPARTTLNTIRAVIRSIVPPDATECISYGLPAFRHNGALVAYAAFRDHCSFFPMGSSVLEAFAAELKNYRVSKGTLHFPLDKPLPAPLVKKIVKARLAQNAARKKR